MAFAEPRVLKLGVTHTFEQSGIAVHLFGAFEAATGIAVRAVVQGTGQTLKIAERGDVDAVLVHEPEGEQVFIAAGFGIDRRPVMANDFLLVGPQTDTSLRGAADFAAAFARLAAGRGVFISRGDQSGTHATELRIWRDAGIAPATLGAARYRETGSGQGATLNVAAQLGAYTLSDRATWANFRNKAGLAIVFDRPGERPNPYHVIRVPPARHPHVRADLALAFADWLTGPAGRAAIAAYRIDAVQAFMPADGGA